MDTMILTASLERHASTVPAAGPVDLTNRIPLAAEPATIGAPKLLSYAGHRCHARPSAQALDPATGEVA